MADKNLHDIKIDELDSPKKTPLKNIITLIALLFIILVISIVITKLILNTDNGETLDNNDTKVQLTTTNIDEKNESEETEENSSTILAIPTIPSTIKERNLTSVIKTPLTSHQPKKETEAIKTYSAPKKTVTPPRTKKPTVKKEPTAAKAPKKEYVDRVIVKKEPKETSAVPSSKSATYLGGERKDVSNSYYIKVGTYRDATTIIEKIKKNNFNYSLVKVENDKTLLRVLVGPFFSRNQAATQLPKVQADILPNAYITKAK